MILRSEHFNELFEKIAQTITGITQSTSSREKNLNKGGNTGALAGNYNRRGDKLDLQSTISKARDKADLQPLHKDTSIIFRPADASLGSKMRNKQEYLGHLEDKRITHHHLRNR